VVASALIGVAGLIVRDTVSAVLGPFFGRVVGAIGLRNAVAVIGCGNILAANFAPAGRRAFTIGVSNLPIAVAAIAVPIAAAGVFDAFGASVLWAVAATTILVAAAVAFRLTGSAVTGSAVTGPAVTDSALTGSAVRREQTPRAATGWRRYGSSRTGGSRRR
jgi:hypothetical protein